MKKQLLAAASALLFAIPFAASADTIGSIDFENYSLGNINGQHGWSMTGSYDVAVDSSFSTPTFGDQSLRISNAVTSGSFGDQTFAPGLATPAGEADADNGSFGAAMPASHYEAQFDIFALPESTGDTLSVSPDRGDGARMSYLRFENPGDGSIHVYFYDVQGTDTSANFVQTPVATLAEGTPHTVKFVMDLLDGPSNDVVKIYIDGALVHTGTTWENYYRFDPESNPSLNPDYVPTVRTLLFRAGGAEVLSNSGKGYLIDNLSLSSSNPTLAACPAGTAQSDSPETLSIDSSSSAGVSSSALTSGKKYLVVASGTWTNRSNANQAADAEYATLDNWATHMDGYDQPDFHLGTGEFDLQVDQGFVNWGAYSSTHEYSYLYTGTGGAANFRIFDGDSTPPNPAPNDGWYGDNNGSLTVALYACDTDVPPPSGVPSDKNQCKDNGWKTLVDSSGHHFKNQGDCVSFVATKGKNKGAGN